MIAVLSSLGFLIAVGVLLYVVMHKYQVNCRRCPAFCCQRCRRRAGQASSREAVLVRVDLASGEVRTLRSNSLPALAASDAVPQDPEEVDANPSTPMMPSCTRLSASKVSIATQTTCLLQSCSSNSSIGSLSPVPSVDVGVFDKSMWVTRSPDTTGSPNTTDQMDDSTLVDTSRETVLAATQFIDTTYFEESSETGNQVAGSSPHFGSPVSEAGAATDLSDFVSQSGTCHPRASTSTHFSTSSSPCFSLGLEGAGSDALDSCKPFDPENAETECPDLESDRESYYTCKSENEEAASVKDMNLSSDADFNVNQPEDKECMAT